MTDSAPPLAQALSVFRPVVVNDLIRLGRDQDGGYVVSARTIDEAEVLVGLGICDEWSFESAFAARRPHASVYAVDGTVSPQMFEERRTTHLLQAAWSALRLRRWLTLHHLENARQCGRTGRDFRRLFDQPDRHFISSMIREPGRPGITWSELVERIDEAERATGTAPPKLFVKMDIEGSEYRVLPAVLADAARITGIAIEFHDTDLLWERLHEQLVLVLEQFVVVHVHGNNYMPTNAKSALPRSLEVSFANRSLVTADELRAVNGRTYPLNGLDHPNCASLPELRLDFGTTSA